MKRKVSFVCELCGSSFASSEECAKHEAVCKDRRYYIQNSKKRIKKYLRSIEDKDFVVCVNYDTLNQRCFISLIDKRCNKIKN